MRLRMHLKSLRWLSRLSTGCFRAQSSVCSSLSTGRQKGRAKEAAKNQSKSSICMRAWKMILEHSLELFPLLKSYFTLTKESTTSRMSQVSKRLQVLEVCEKSLEDLRGGILSHSTTKIFKRRLLWRSSTLTFILSSLVKSNSSSSIASLILLGSFCAQTCASVVHWLVSQHKVVQSSIQLSPCLFSRTQINLYPLALDYLFKKWAAKKIRWRLLHALRSLSSSSSSWLHIHQFPLKRVLSELSILNFTRLRRASLALINSSGYPFNSYMMTMSLKILSKRGLSSRGSRMCSMMTMMALRL